MAPVREAVELRCEWAACSFAAAAMEEFCGHVAQHLRHHLPGERRDELDPLGEGPLGEAPKCLYLGAFGTFWGVFVGFCCRGVHVPVAGVRVLLAREPGRPGAPRLLPLLPHQAEAVGAARPAGSARRQPLPAGLPEPQHHPRDPGELPLPVGVLRGEGSALLSAAQGPGEEICASPASIGGGCAPLRVPAGCWLRPEWASHPLLLVSPPRQRSFDNPEWFYRHVEDHSFCSEYKAAGKENHVVLCGWKGSGGVRGFSGGLGVGLGCRGWTGGLCVPSRVSESS